MNTESVERLSMFVWLCIAVWLGILAVSSSCLRPAKLLRAVLWTAFVCFTFTWIPVLSFGIVAVPSTFAFVEGLVALPFNDGSARFYGVARPSIWFLISGCLVLFSISVAAIVSFTRASKIRKNESPA
jgi:hypothetical protein